MCNIGKSVGRFCKNKLDEFVDKRADRSDRESEDLSSPSETGDVYLHLILPASEVSNLEIEKNEKIDFPRIESLIDSCLFFLCSTQKQLYLEKDEMLSIQGQREAYLNIYIPNGQAMLGKTTLYPLKRDFPLNEKGIVVELFMLKNCSEIEKFNRV